jgi:hypothetical protein
MADDGGENNGDVPGEGGRGPERGVTPEVGASADKSRSANESTESIVA